MFWREWLKTLLGLTVLLGIVEMLLPPGDVARFSKLVLGLAVMLAVLQPLTTFLSLNPEIAPSSPRIPSPPEQDLLVLADEIRWAGAKSLLESGGDSLIRQMEALLLTIEQIEEVQVEIQGSSLDRQMVVVRINPTTPSLEGRVRKIVGGILNLGEHQVRIEGWYE